VFLDILLHTKFIYLRVNLFPITSPLGDSIPYLLRQRKRRMGRRKSSQVGNKLSTWPIPIVNMK